MLALASHLVHALPGAGELCPDGPLAIGQTVRLPGIARTLRAIARHGRDGFYRGEFGRGLLELGAGHFAPADLGHQRGGLVHAAARRRLGPRAVDRAAPVAGLPDAGRRRGGRGGRARDRARTTRNGPTCSSRRGAPSATTARRCSSTAPTATASWTRLAWPPRPPGWMRSPRRPPTSRRAGGGRPRRGPPGRRGHHAPVRARCRRPRRVADAVQRARLRLPSRGAHHRCLPAQPWRRLLARPGPPAEVAPGRRPPHTLSPMLVTRRDGALTHVVGAMGGDVQPQILVQLLARLLRRTGPGHGHLRATGDARGAGGRALPPVVGQACGAHGVGRAPGLARRA